MAAIPTFYQAQQITNLTEMAEFLSLHGLHESDKEFLIGFQKDIEKVAARGGRQCNIKYEKMTFGPELQQGILILFSWDDEDPVMGYSIAFSQDLYTVVGTTAYDENELRAMKHSSTLN